MAKKPTNNITKNNLQLINIEPLTQNQQLFFDKFSSHDHHLLLGAAGTGKTFLALAKAFTELQLGNASKIVIFRSSVASRDQGFLPGTAEEKMSVFETPYRTITNTLFNKGDAYEILTKHHTILFESTAYQRGTTLDNTIIIIDECQNMTANELDTLITRTGEYSRIIVCGDLEQQDLTRTSERTVHKVLNILEDLPSFHSTHFTVDDIVRSGIVKEYLTKKHQHYPSGY